MLRSKTVRKGSSGDYTDPRQGYRENDPGWSVWLHPNGMIETITGHVKGRTGLLEMLRSGAVKLGNFETMYQARDFVEEYKVTGTVPRGE